MKNQKRKDSGNKLQSEKQATKNKKQQPQKGNESPKTSNNQHNLSPQGGKKSIQRKGPISQSISPANNSSDPYSQQSFSSNQSFVSKSYLRNEKPNNYPLNEQEQWYQKIPLIGSCFSGNQNVQQPKQPIYQFKDGPEGLPNIGNTCFLNSFLQFIYGAAKFRSLLIEKAKQIEARQDKYQFYDLIFLIGKLFFLLQEKKGQNKQKYWLLERLTSKLESINLLYVKYRQQDAFQTLLNIINEIDSQLQSKKESIKPFFSIKILESCYCTTQPFVYESLHLSQDIQSCTKCKQTFKKKFLATPEYLILVNNPTEDKGFRINSQNYQFVSKVLYFGSGHSGHYTCVRVQKEKRYELNDSSVYQQRQYSPYSNQYSPYSQHYGPKHIFALFQKSSKFFPELKLREKQSVNIVKEPYRTYHQQYPSFQKQLTLDSDYPSFEKVYLAKIKTPCGYFEKKDEYAFDQRQIYFEIIKSNKENCDLINILNHNNFIYYEKNRQSFNKDFKALHKKQYTYATPLKDIISIIQKLLNDYCISQLQLKKKNRKEMIKCINEIFQASKIPFDSQKFQVVEVCSKVKKSK